MNISNVLYRFTEEIVTAAANNSALSNARIHADVYEEIKPGKTIRIDDVRQATPVLTANGAIRRDNAAINIQFLMMPVSQVLSDRLAARQTAEEMADAWFASAFENLYLQANFCAIGRTAQFNDWIKPGTVKIPVCVLRLLINPQKTD